MLTLTRLQQSAAVTVAAVARLEVLLPAGISALATVPASHSFNLALQDAQVLPFPSALLSHACHGLLPPPSLSSLTHTPLTRAGAATG